jgi:hypothetical protein
MSSQISDWKFEVPVTPKIEETPCGGATDLPHLSPEPELEEAILVFPDRCENARPSEALSERSFSCALSPSPCRKHPQA